jgi:hypothetical protein
MKTCKNVCATIALLFALSVSVLAGDIHTNGAVAPPPPPPASATIAVSEEMGEPETEPVGLVAEITLSLLQLLSVY